jgi:hypothetical protein
MLLYLVFSLFVLHCYMVLFAVNKPIKSKNTLLKDLYCIWFFLYLFSIVTWYCLPLINLLNLKIQLLKDLAHISLPAYGDYLFRRC